MTNYFKLPTWADSDHLHAVVETPRGSRAKLEFDSKLGAFTLAKALLAGLTYPYDWGFIPSTRAEDGDPLDVLIMHEDAATYPGLVLKCKPIGVAPSPILSAHANEAQLRRYFLGHRGGTLHRLPAAGAGWDRDDWMVAVSSHSCAHGTTSVVSPAGD